MTKPPDILLDCDVIRHFLKGGQILLLPKLYPERLVILDKVLSELNRSPQLRLPIANFVQLCRIKITPFPTNDEIFQEYARLKGLLYYGEGESACMAYAKFNPHIIASSNLKDIKEYCKRHKITFITTMDILEHAYNTGLLTEQHCNLFIADVRSKGSILPCKNMQEYYEKFK